MMKKNFIYAAMAVIMASCSNEQESSLALQGDVKLDVSSRVIGSVEVGPTTKAETDPLKNAQVGIFAWETGATPTNLATTTLANNLYNVAADGKFVGAPSIQLYSTKTYEACAYAPQKATTTVFGVDSRTVAFTHDATGAKGMDDVLYSPIKAVTITPLIPASGETPATPAKATIEFPFVHKMAQITVVLEGLDGASSLLNAKVDITGFLPGGTLNLKTGAFEATSIADGIGAKISQTCTSNDGIAGFTSVCVVPGTLNLKYAITASDGTPYKLERTGEIFEAGKSYTIRMKLKKGTTSLEVLVGTVEKWVTGAEVSFEIPSTN